MFGILNGIVSDTRVAISLAGCRDGRATPVGNYMWLHNGKGGGSRDGTGEVGSIVGAGVGNDKGIELDGRDGIVSLLEISMGISACVDVGALGSGWLGFRVINDRIIG